MQKYIKFLISGSKNASNFRSVQAKTHPVSDQCKQKCIQFQNSASISTSSFRPVQAKLHPISDQCHLKHSLYQTNPSKDTRNFKPEEAHIHPISDQCHKNEHSISNQYQLKHTHIQTNASKNTVHFRPVQSKMTKSSTEEVSLGEGKQEGRWLWKANEELEFYNAADRYGTRIGMACVTLNSAEPLNYDQVKTSFQIVQRKCLNLRLTLQTRGSELWFRELLDADVDFKVLEEDTDIIEAMEKYSKEDFDNTGKPFWRVRIIPRSMNAPCVSDDVKLGYPYQYDYILNANHILLDGINSALVVQMSHTILNDLIDGKVFNDTEQYGGDFAVHGGLPKELEDEIVKRLQENPNRLASLTSEMPSPNKTLWLTKAHPRPEDAKPATKHISRIIDSEMLTKFKDKSKQVGATFNSSFVAMINAAFVDLMVEGGVREKSYRLHVNHLVNLRRYMGKTEKIPLGAYQFPLSHFSDVSVTVKEHFWEYAKNYHQDLQANLKSGTVLEQKTLKRQKKSFMSPAEFFLNPPPVVHDFSVSNVGDMTAFIPGTGKHVQITDLRSFNFIHNFIHMQLHQLVSYRGHSRYTLSYDTSYMSDETANKVVDKVFCTLKELSK